MSKSIMTRVVKKSGFIWGKGTLSAKIVIDPEKLERVRRFFFEYKMTLEEQANGTAIIVYMDESYVNVKHGNNYTFYNPNAPVANKIQRGTGKGGNILAIHKRFI